MALFRKEWHEETYILNLTKITMLPAVGIN